MDEKYDVVIVGAGPAGLSCAIELQKSELSVLLLEKNKEIGPKVCAGGLTTKIKEFGIPLDFAEILFSKVKLSVKDKKIKISNDGIPFVGTVDRNRLGKFLVSKLSEKITIRTGCRVAEIGSNFVVADGRKIFFKYLVGADGSNSLVRKSLDLKSDKFLVAIQYIVPKSFKNLEFHFDTSLFGSGYSWIFPHLGYSSVGCCKDIRSCREFNLKKNLDVWLNKISIKNTNIQGWTINFDYRGFWFENKFLVGDAGGFASGLTGEGIYFGLVSGRDVAGKILDQNYECRGIAEILRIKKRHERLLSIANFFVSLNKPLTNFFLGWLIGLGKYHWFAKKLIKNYG